MNEIFTYPNNAGTSYIDPWYVGDATDGFQKRIQDLKDGNYKAWDGTAPTDTVNELMSDISKFARNYYSKVGDNNITIDDMYTYPLLKGTVTVVPGVPITTTISSSSINGYFVSVGHGLTDGDVAAASLFNGDYAVLNGNNYYVQVYDANIFRLSVDAGLTQIISLYDLGNADVTSDSGISLNTTPAHDLTTGMHVNISGLDGTWAAFNGTQAYALTDINNPNKFWLSRDVAQTEFIGVYDLKEANVSSTDSLNPSTITTTASHLMTDSMQVTLSGFDGDWADYNGQTLYVDSISSTKLQLATDPALQNKIGFATYYGAQSINSFDIFSTPMSFTPLGLNTMPDDASVIIFNSFQAPEAPKEIIDAINAYSTTLYSKVNGSVIELYTDESLTIPFVFTQAMRNYTQTERLPVYTGTGLDSNDDPYDYGNSMGIEVIGTSIVNGSKITVNEVDWEPTNTLYGVMDADTSYYYNNGRVYTDLAFTTEVSNFRANVSKCEVFKNPDANGWFHRDYLDDTGLIALNDGSGNVTLQTIDDAIVDDGNPESVTFITNGWSEVQTKNTYRDWAYASANNLIYNMPYYHNTSTYGTATLDYSGFTVDGGERVFRMNEQSPQSPFAFTTLMSTVSGWQFPFPVEHYTPYNATATYAYSGPYTYPTNTITRFMLDASYTTRVYSDYKGPGTGVGAAFNAGLYTPLGPAILKASGQQPSIVELYTYTGSVSNYVVMIPMAPSNNMDRCDVICYDIDANGVVGNTMLSNLLPGASSSQTNISTHNQGVRLTDNRSVAVPVDIEVVGIPAGGGWDAMNEFFIPDFAASNDLRMGDIVSLFGTDWVVFPQGPTTSGGYPGIAYSVFPYTDADTALAFGYNADIFGANTTTTLTTSYNSWITLSDDIASNYGMIDYSTIPINGLKKAKEIKVVPVRVTGDYDANYEPVPTTTGYIEEVDTTPSWVIAEVNPIPTTTGTVVEVDTTPSWVYASVNPVLATVGQTMGETPDTYDLTSVELVIPGQKQYLHIESSGATVPGIEVETILYRNTDDKTRYEYYPSTPDISVTIDANGRLSDATLNATLTGFTEPKEILIDVRALPDEYVPSTISRASREDIFDTQDQWQTEGFNGAKEFGRNIIPSSAVITYDQPSTVNKSQNGTKYVRTAGFVKMRLEVNYDCLTEEEFQILHADVQGARGQANTFYLVHSQWGQKVLNFANPKSTDTPKLVEPYVAGTALYKFGGFESNESEAFKKGEMIVGGGSYTGGLSTVLNTVDANVYGEAEVRIAYGNPWNLPNGSELYKNPYHMIVTLDNDEFQYSVDTFGKYNVTVEFELGDWNE